MKTAGSKIYKAISLILLISVMLTIFVLSHQNGSESSNTSGLVTNFLSLIFGDDIPEAIVRTFGHFSEFAALGFLTLNCFYAFKKELKPFLSVTLSWLYAWTDEFHQIFVDGRAFQISDLMVDLGGILTGTALIYCIIKTLKLISNKKKSKN